MRCAPSRRCAAFAVARAVAAVAAAAAQRQRRRQPGPAKDFVIPKPKRFTLSNGLPVTMVPFGLVPKVTIQLVVEAANVHEQKEQSVARGPDRQHDARRHDGADRRRARARVRGDGRELRSRQRRSGHEHRDRSAGGRGAKAVR